ncbi:MAG TPA: GerMN domain-containing protein [Acidimicrobiales bacterium]|nr:GerMN domain-containing protein [Acidimicrobiales bacterium]
MSSRARAWLRLLVAAVVLVAASACTVPTNEQPVELGGTLPSGLLNTTTAPTAPTDASATEVPVYFLSSRDGTTTLVEAIRSVDEAAGVQGILVSLFSQPPREDVPAESGLSSAIPESATLLSANRAVGNPEQLVVDVRGLFGAIQGDALRDALAQIVWTATERGNGIESVVFRNDGEPVQALIDDLESTADPVVKGDYARSS